MSRTKQRGSGWSIHLALWFYGLFGYLPFFILLYPITFIYFLKASNVKRALKLYYKQIGIKYTQWRYFEHLRRFAIVMTDRFISKCDPASYNVIADEKKIADLMKDGGLLLFSHFGGWSVAAELLYKTNLKVNIIMQEVIKNDIKSIEKKLSYAKSNVNIIDLQNTSVLNASITIAKALLKKEVVAMMGDRANNPKHTVKTEFFGREAEFNKTPFEISKKSNLPLIAIFVTYIKPRVYKTEFTLIKTDKSIEDMLRQYAEAYEAVIRKAPNQWFNLYDFWGEQNPN